MPAKDHYDAIVIGAGHNGLIAAAYLARGGMSVRVVERREILGGACVTEELWPGYKVSTASYLCSLLQERIINDLDLPRFGYRVYAKDPAFFTPFPDGRHLTMWQDQKRTCEEIAKFSRHDADVYPQYEEFIEKLAQFAEGMLFRTPPNFTRANMGDMIGLGKLGWELMHMPDDERAGQVRIFTQSVAEFLEPWFQSEEIKVTLATDGVIGTNGGPRSPGTAYVLLHHVMGSVDGHRGLWGFVRGGMGAISQAIADAARAAGAEISAGATVDHVIIEEPAGGPRAAGVVLTNGEEIRAPFVVSCADPKVTFLKLVGEKNLPEEFSRAIRGIAIQGCSMKINLALDGLPDFRAIPGAQLQPHHKTTMHICPDIDYVERAWDDAKYGKPSAQPLIEMTIPTAYDDSIAPPGKHLMGIFLQYTPYKLRDANWHDVKESYADHVMDVIEEYAPGFKSLVRHRQVLSPLDLEEIYGLTGGNIFHGEMNLSQLFFMRPVPGWARYRTPLRGLYLCGSGAHPGGGVMGAPGYNAAREILLDKKRGRPN
jgi:phytoene dehydrogenase-like protein